MAGVPPYHILVDRPAPRPESCLPSTRGPTALHFTRLRLLGFKSFVDPTELVIAPGLTGVVGPNGCGKSNLLEALRWVMGENRPSVMRGDGMEDVIFAGSAARPARNHAEVTLTIDNRDRRAPAGFNDDDELTIVRRITRDAGSAYRVGGPRGAGARRRDAVRRRLDRGDLAGAGPAGADRRADQRPAEGAAAHPRGGGRHLRPLPAPARGRAEAARDRGEPRPRRRRARGARHPAREPRPAGAAGGALPRDRRGAAPGRGAAGLARTGTTPRRPAPRPPPRSPPPSAPPARRRPRRPPPRALRAEAEEALPALRDEDAIAGAVLQRLTLERDRLDAEAEAARREIAGLEAQIAQLAADREREAALDRDAVAMAARLAEEAAGLAAEGDGHDAGARRGRARRRRRGGGGAAAGRGRASTPGPRPRRGWSPSTRPPGARSRTRAAAPRELARGLEAAEGALAAADARARPQARGGRAGAAPRPRPPRRRRRRRPRRPARRGRGGGRRGAAAPRRPRAAGSPRPRVRPGRSRAEAAGLERLLARPAGRGRAGARRGHRRARATRWRSARRSPTT